MEILWARPCDGPWQCLGCCSGAQATPVTSHHHWQGQRFNLAELAYITSPKVVEWLCNTSTHPIIPTMMNLKTLFGSLYLLITCLTYVHSFTLIQSLVSFNEFKANGACLSSIKKPAADEIGSSPTLSVIYFELQVKLINLTYGNYFSKDCFDPNNGASTWDLVQPTFENGHIGTDGLCLNTSCKY